MISAFVATRAHPHWGEIEIVFAPVILGLTVVLAPFSGPALPGSEPRTAKFSVAVHGSGGQRVTLRALDVPTGYVASFCTKLVCAPFSVALALPNSGDEHIELQLIENVPGAHKPHTVIVAANGVRTSIAFSRAGH